MCNHFLALHTYRHAQMPKALWRCSTCGRQARMPIDCCTRPDFAAPQRAGLVPAGMRWLGAVAAGALGGLRRMIHYWRRPAVGIPLEDMTEPTVVEPTAAGRRRHEQPEADELLVTAGSSREDV